MLNKSTSWNSVETIDLQLETEKPVLNKIRLSMAFLKYFFVLRQYQLEAA